jgi:Uma2 family endonuclease
MRSLVMPVSEPIGRLLTPAEYDGLPANSRRELVDGVVHMMATPTPFHQDVAHALREQLNRRRPDDLRVTGEVEIRLDDLRRRNPDVVVVRADGYDRRMPQLEPAQVVLAVEVVSPGSESVDRIFKPIEYAAAGIAHFWRIEVESEVVVHTYQLGDAKVYESTGVFKVGGTIAALGLLWASIPVGDLLGDD